jgi:hypothetical protein
MITRRSRLSVAVLAMVAVLATAGCDRASAAFERADLDAIVLTPIDAPEGTAYSSSVSGFQELVGFARDAQEKDALVIDGFIVGHLALFAPVGASEPGQGPPLPDDAPFAQGITGLFDDGDGASNALRRFVDHMKSEQLGDPVELDALEVGDESYAFRGIASGSSLLMYAWREDNLVLAVGGAGSVPPDVVRRLALAVQDRAAGTSA